MTMRKLAVAAALAAAVSLGACSTVAPLLMGESFAHQAPQSAADAEKALTIAHLAYQAIGVSLQDVAQSGALHGANAATARALYDKAGTLLDTADQADALANAQGVFAAVGEASALIAQIKSLIPR
jgi:1,2-phenylacetyl-CoA epoxidase PaaB subunit